MLLIKKNKQIKSQDKNDDDDDAVPSYVFGLKLLCVALELETQPREARGL